MVGRLLLLLTIATTALAQSNCPTGAQCGTNSTFCNSYTPPSTSGATDLLTLTTGYGGAILITAAGNYFLSADVSKAKSGIAVLTTSGSVDINLNGHTLTYGTTADGTGTTQIGEYGILMCNTGNIASESLDNSYSTNGLCVSGGLSSSNVTIENGTITQSTGASAYYDPNNCPGSGVGSGSGGACGNPHDTIASHVIVAQYNHNVKITHVTMTFQNTDTRGILYQNQQPGTGMDIECNTLNDKVTRLNKRPEAHGAIWSGNLTSANSANTVKYNTIAGSPQNGIVLGVGGVEPTGSILDNNDVNVGLYQCPSPPCTSSSVNLQMYTNDYSIGGCMPGGEIAFNYIHSVNGRGITCIFGNDQNNEAVHDNYINTGEVAVNGEYGSNGTVNGGSWITNQAGSTGGCEIDGGRGFETKGSEAMQLYNNTFILNVSQCGAGGITFVEFPCPTSDCPGAPTTATHPFNVHDNTIQINNTSGSSTTLIPQPSTCFLLDQVQGNYDTFFQPFKNNTCTTDGDFVMTDGFDPGNQLSFYTHTYTKGSHPLSSGCGGASSSTCGSMMHWEGQQSPPNDELGFIYRDIKLTNGASLSFSGASGTPLARGATVQWTQTVFCKGAINGWYINGCSLTYTDSQSNTYTGTTGATGSATIVVSQELVSSPANNATLTTTNFNTQSLSASATGCTTNNQSGLSITAVATTIVTLAGCSGTINPIAWAPGPNGRDYVNGSQQNGKSYSNGLTGANGRKYP